MLAVSQWVSQEALEVVLTLSPISAYREWLIVLNGIYVRWCQMVK